MSAPAPARHRSAALYRAAEPGAGHALPGAGVPGAAARHRLAHRRRPGRSGRYRRRGMLAAARRSAGRAAQPAPDPVHRRRRGPHLRRPRRAAPRAGLPRGRGGHGGGHEQLRRLGGDQPSPPFPRLRAQPCPGVWRESPIVPPSEHRVAIAGLGRLGLAAARWRRWVIASRAGAARPSPIWPRASRAITAPTACRRCWPRPTRWSACCR